MRICTDITSNGDCLESALRGLSGMTTHISWGGMPVGIKVLAEARAQEGSGHKVNLTVHTIIVDGQRVPLQDPIKLHSLSVELKTGSTFILNALEALALKQAVERANQTESAPAPQQPDPEAWLAGNIPAGLA